MLWYSGAIAVLARTWEKKRFEAAYLTLAGELSQLLDGGLALEQAVDYLSDKHKSNQEQVLLKAAQEALKNGEFISAVWKPMLSALAVTVLETGERAGRLPEVMKVWVDERTMEREWIEKLIKASSYPMFLMVGNAAVQLVLAWLVIPDFRMMYSAVHVHLSPASEMLMIVVQNLPMVEVLVLALLVATLVGLLWIRKAVPLWWHGIHRVLPGKRVLWAQRTQRFCTLLGVLLDSGLPVLDALTQLYTCQGPQWLSEQCRQVHLNLLQGATLSDAFSVKWDPLLSAALHIADKTGELAAAIHQTGVYLRRDVLKTMDRTVKWIEPALIIILGVIVTATMYILFVPMYQLVSSVSAGTVVH